MPDPALVGDGLHSGGRDGAAGGRDGAAGGRDGAAVFPDASSRQRVREDLDSTLFVEAGAGSGKTTELVARLVRLVTTGTAELASIAAITFTDKAAAELRDRVRAAFTKGAAGSDPDVAARSRLALDQLDGAAIGTLHAFAQRLLSEHPIEAALPPRIEVLDEVSSGVAFERRFAAFRDALLEDPAYERTLLLLFAAGVKPEALRSLALAFGDNWDLVAEHVDQNPTAPPPVRPLVDEALGAIDAVCELRHLCRAADDLLAARLEQLLGHIGWLRSLDNEIDLLEAIGDNPPRPAPSFAVGNCGRQQNWPDVVAVRDAVSAVGSRLDDVCAVVADACAHHVGAAIARFTLAGAEARRADGQLEFHDLLVMARALLRDPEHGPGVRAHLHGRYQRILLDEFQDTDPIQIELAVRIAAAEPASAAAGTLAWDAVDVAPGHLFIVGDPKQSIYRFRRADIRTFLAAQRHFGGDGGLVRLTTNFRSARPLIDWLNGVFGVLMDITPGNGDAAQPPFVALDPVRAAPLVGPPVAILGRDPHPQRTLADDVRAAEAAEAAAAIGRVINEGWSVAEEPHGWRPARLGDIAILVPARTSLPFLEDALEAAGIPFRAEASSLVYATRAVRDVLMVLRAVDDPTDKLRVVAALRTPLLACGDDDLFRFKVERGGHWSYLVDQPAEVPDDDPVAMGLSYLRTLHDERQWRTPSELLDRIVRDRRAMELGFVEHRPRDVWRRLRFVIDQARAWSESTGGSLRQYLHWVSEQTAEGARVAEAVLPETDDDAVRIMTIHAAKGLEFPVTIVSGLSTLASRRRAPGEVVFGPGGVGYRFGRHVVTEEFEAWLPIDEQMAFDERVRLLYVACTRARDHVVVSLHRVERVGDPPPARLTNAELLAHAIGGELAALPSMADDDEPGPAVALEPIGAGASTPPPFAAFNEWATEWSAALAASSRPTTVAATALTDEGEPDPDRALGGPRWPGRDPAPPPDEPDPAPPPDEPDPAPPPAEPDPAPLRDEPDPGLRKRPRDLDLPPWLKGRYGTAVGRAVHGVLQTIDLASGDGMDAAVAAQCEAEAIPHEASRVRQLVSHALAAPSVRAAAASEHWREVYACAPVGDRLLEGYVDLLYRGADGLVVIDYKTAATSDPAVLDERLEHYRLQGASYATVVGLTTGEPVSSVVFIFLTPDGPVERTLTDLEQATTDVRALVTAGHEVLAD
jgi:ATP-dependent exoDNAse (exonuclease V) beta subunit